MEVLTMNSTRLFLALATILLLLHVSGEVILADTSRAVATVQKVSGMATVVRQGRSMAAEIGLEIYQNDTLRTGPGGSIGVIFNDETSLSLGPDSMIVVDEFVFAPAQGNFSIAIRMVKGTVAYLSGLISKLSPESARFETPTASIGIRGTKFVARVEGE